MASHRSVLADLLKDRGISHSKIALAMGWSTPSTAGNKLRGERDWKFGELETICELAGTTIAALAVRSDDLRITLFGESLEAAELIDTLPTKQKRETALKLLREIVALSGSSSRG
jgi:transcriptional regulator with XRE-family HTH domain